MRLTELLEGVKVRQKDKDNAISRGDFRIGIEYEFRGFIFDDNGEKTNMNVDNVPDILKQYGISYKSIEREHDFQVEVITDVMGLSDGLNHIQRMLKLLKTKNEKMHFEVDEQKSGMHISISLKNSEHEFNPLKFLLLMNTKYIGTIFPERTHTQDNTKMLLSLPTIQDIDSYDIEFDENELRKFETNVNNEILGKDKRFTTDDQLKYNAIKLSDYATYDGRVELRFFGGKEYLNFPLVKDQIARSLYLLDVSHGNKFDTEYKKALYKFYSNVPRILGGDLLRDLQSESDVNGKLLRELHTEWNDLNADMDNKLNDEQSVLYYLKLSSYVKRFLPNAYDKHKQKFGRAIEILDDVNGDLMDVIKISPTIVNTFVDIIVRTRFNHTLNISKLPDNIELPITMSTWAKLISVPNLESISLSDYDDPLSLDTPERVSLSKIFKLYKKINSPHLNSFFKDYGKLLFDNVENYTQFSNLDRIHSRILRDQYPGLMEDLMLKDLDM